MGDTKEIIIENRLDYNKFLLDPAAVNRFQEISKDLALSNLDPTKLMICEMRQEIIGIMLSNFGECAISLASFERDQVGILQLNRSKHGFESKLQRSTLTADATNTKNFEQQKAATIFDKRVSGP